MTAPLTGKLVTTADKRSFWVVEISQLTEDRRQQTGNAMKREDMAAMDSVQRIISLKHGLLSNFAEMARLNPKMDILPGVVAYVSVYSDSQNGCCNYSVARIARFFHRNEDSIRNALARGEAQRLLFREELPDGSWGYWPYVEKSLVNVEISTHWIADAYAPPLRRGRRPKGITPAPTGVNSENYPCCNPELPPPQPVQSTVVIEEDGSQKEAPLYVKSGRDDGAATTPPAGPRPPRSEGGRP